MAGQIYRNLVEVPRKVQRLAWLTSQAPAYGEQLPWYHKPPPPPDPPPHPDQRGGQARAWVFSPMPAYAESVVWRHPQPQPPDPPPLPDQRGAQAGSWSFSPMPGYADSLPWRRSPGPTVEPLATIAVQAGYRVAPWTTSPPPAPPGDPLPWWHPYVEPVPLPPIMPPRPRRDSWIPTLTPRPPPIPPHAGKNKPFVDRVPEATNRLRRHTEKVSEILNSLMGNGDIYQTGPKSWAISAATFVEARAPDFNDDETHGVQPGSRWIDTNAGTIWFAVSTAPGAAVWKGPY